MPTHLYYSGQVGDGRVRVRVRRRGSWRRGCEEPDATANAGDLELLTSYENICENEAVGKLQKKSFH